MQIVSVSESNCSSEPAPEFESVVDRYYLPLYRFALSLTHSEADACDLTQQTFYTFRAKGGQLRDVTKLRSWLFTTMHRAFLQGRRRETRFPHFELDEVDAELPVSLPDSSRLDLPEVLAALARLEETFRAPLALFYLEDRPHKATAAILATPLRTVQ